jgi:hypothetical protein
MRDEQENWLFSLYSIEESLKIDVPPDRQGLKETDLKNHYFFWQGGEGIFHSSPL